jgi:hypothetical protein
LLTISLFLLSQTSQGKQRESFVEVFISTGEEQASQYPIFAVPDQRDPLASVDPLFGHSTSRYSFGMSGTEGPHSTQPGLQPNYEVNRPTRVLPEEEGLRSCTVTVATKSFAHRCVKTVE